jgi:hypothetical protein
VVRGGGILPLSRGRGALGRGPVLGPLAAGRQLRRFVLPRSVGRRPRPLERSGEDEPRRSKIGIDVEDATASRDGFIDAAEVEQTTRLMEVGIRPLWSQCRCFSQDPNGILDRTPRRRVEGET